MNWRPPRSPWSLIQEDIYPNEWRCLVVCILLNCTTRKQIEKILPEFFHRWPTAKNIVEVSSKDIEDLISCLGFGKRRTQRLQDMSAAYLKGDWKHVSELPGIGEYASRMWEIFFCGILGNEPPKDGALKLYWYWVKLLNRQFLTDHKVDDNVFVNKERQEWTTA